MPLAFLLNVPSDDNSWEQFGWNNQDILSKIRQAIQVQSGSITGIETTSNGSGYTSAPSVSIIDVKGFGTGATATAIYTITSGFYNITFQIDSKGSGYVEPVVNLTGGGGSGATAQAVFTPVTNLPQYQTYPINRDTPQDFQFWLIQNAQAHDDFNSVLNLQSSDLTGVDVKNPQQLEAWIYLNYSELRNACFALGIS